MLGDIIEIGIGVGQFAPQETLYIRLRFVQSCV